MINDEVLGKVEKFLKKEIKTKTKNSLMFQLDIDTYELFNNFIIKVKKNLFYVTHKEKTKIFSSLSNAVAWCILVKRDKFRDFLRLEELDKQIASLEFNIQHHKNLLKKPINLDYKIIYLAKLTDETLKKKKLSKELASFVNEANLWQLKQFESNTNMNQKH